MLVGGLNMSPNNSNLKDFMDSFSGDNLIKQPLCFKSASPTCISLIGGYEHGFWCKAGFKFCSETIS